MSSLSSLVSNVVGHKPSAQKVTILETEFVCRMKEISRVDCLALYNHDAAFIAVFAWPEDSPSKVFSLFRENSQTSAELMFEALSHKLEPLVQYRPKLLKCDRLQNICELLREHPTWTSAHLAAKLALLDFISQATMAEGLNDADSTSRVTPLMVAIEGGSLAVVQELIIKGVDIDVADARGRNVFHYAATGSNTAIIKLLAAKHGAPINQLDLKGESALHVASANGNADIIEHLLRWGADPKLTASGDYPIHTAVENDKPECVETLYRWSREQLTVRDSTAGNTPLHRAHTKECIRLLTHLGSDVNARNSDGNTPLHVKVLDNDLQSVMAVLTTTSKVDINAIGQNGNSALHMAVEVGHPEIVQVLVVFGADIECPNKSDCTPRHLAATSSHANGETILNLLHSVGALRCSHDKFGCTNGCSILGTHIGSPLNTSVSDENTKQYLDNVATDIAIGAAMFRSGSSAETSPTTSLDNSRPGDRVLSLDGGGIRGLILIQTLLAIEKATGMQIRDSFDWIGGTSTGGILALAISHGKSMRHMQSLYFRLKDEVFNGKRPYDSEPLESFMKKEFGEMTRMTELLYPRVLVTGVLADRSPVELHFFRNYYPPGHELDQVTTKFQPPPRPDEQFVWEAARSSGAAPTYFRSYGCFLDGGLMSNNPTLDILTEVHEHNLRLKVIGRQDQERPIHVVVSLGTGKNPTQPIKACDIYRPEGLFDILRVTVGAKNLGAMLLDQVGCLDTGHVGQVDCLDTGHVGQVDCLDTGHVGQVGCLDTGHVGQLVSMLWTTEVYIRKHTVKLIQLAELLKP
ncbi:hypothetical protein NP493_99g04025 [Ridgeia piscesae]|uniref:phospholipase A2 n=1 Tax=Ridgeia piscesae TaxID=27915 RepID=A0AAD9P7W8_RIDPI|nr:hypothetical protein NP493_99g04025 [Ridgeia piscesae]